MNRRDILKLAPASLLTMTALRHGAAFAADPVVMCSYAPMSGAFAANGKFNDMGVKLSVESNQEVLGHPLQHLTIDTEGKPSTAVRRVQEAFEQRNCNYYIGGILSSEALAVGKEADRLGGIMITSAGADEITGVDCNKSTFRWGVPTYSAADQTIRPVAGLHPEAKRWYTITPQYVFGDSLLSASKKIFDDLGLEHVGNSYHSLTEREFSGYLTNAISEKPDALLLLNFGAQCADTIRQAVSFGMKNDMLIVVAWASGLEQFESLGADLCEDIYFGCQYWHTIDTPENKRLVELCQEKYDINPNYSMASAYMETEILLEGMRRAESVDPAKVKAILEDMEFDGLTGKEQIRAGDHQTIKDYYLLKGKAKADMQDPDDYVEVLAAGKSFLPVEESQCDMG